MSEGVVDGTIEGAEDGTAEGVAVEVVSTTETVVLTADRSSGAPEDTAFLCRSVVNAPDVTAPSKTDRCSSTDLTVSYETE